MIKVSQRRFTFNFENTITDQTTQLSNHITCKQRQAFGVLVTCPSPRGVWLGVQFTVLLSGVNTAGIQYINFSISIFGNSICFVRGTTG